jgi:Ca2+-binding RTX toxin-like protein
VHAAALDLLQHSEVIGGDLLLKRAHQNSASNIPDPAPDGSVPSEQSAAEKLVTLGGDLQVAADYENYLNNREAINAVIATNPDSAFTAGWIATFARVKDLGLNHASASDFLGGLVGWLDSVKKAGLVFDAAGVTYNQAGSAALIDIKVANGSFVPGALAAFADQMSETSDASGTTLHFVINSGLVPLGFRGPDSSTLVSGEWRVSGGPGNNLWFGSNATASTFNAVGNGNDILIGGVTSEHIFAGDGWNFVDGGDGFDWITSGSGNDILHGGRGGDRLEGGGGDDSYTFSRSDGADLVIDDYRYLVLDSTGSPAAPGTTGGSRQLSADHCETDSCIFKYGEVARLCLAA